MEDEKLGGFIVGYSTDIGMEDYIPSKDIPSKEEEEITESEVGSEHHYIKIIEKQTFKMITYNSGKRKKPQEEHYNEEHYKVSFQKIKKNKKNIFYD